MKQIVIFLTCITLSFGFIETRDHHDKAEILTTLDIDPSFINSTLYVNFENPYKNSAQRNYFRAMSRGFAFVPMVRQMIREADIPDLFLYMAMAESGFSLKAYSSKRASGLWQFMPYTAKRFGLRIDTYVDERRDPVKSTKAAINYLKDLHGRFGKWYLAALAYNCGEGRVAWAIRKAGSDDLLTLIDPVKKYLPRETRNYIKKIVHLAMISQNEELLLNSDFDYLMNRGEAYSLAKVSVPGGESLERISEIIKVNKSDLQTYNPHLRYGLTPPDEKRYSIYIPYMNLADFKAYYKSSDMKSFFMVHTVKSGDTLGAISRKYGVSYKMVKEFNKLHSSIIYPKQRLIIPVSKKNYKRLHPDFYRVQSGDTLSTIARKFKVSVSKLKEMNNISGNTIYRGEKLVVSN